MDPKRDSQKTQDAPVQATRRKGPFWQTLRRMVSTPPAKGWVSEDRVRIETLELRLLFSGTSWRSPAHSKKRGSV